MATHESALFYLNMPVMLALVGSTRSHLHGLAHVAPLGDTDLIAGLHLQRSAFQFR